MEHTGEGPSPYTQDDRGSDSLDGEREGEREGGREGDQRGTAKSSQM